MMLTFGHWRMAHADELDMVMAILWCEMCA